MMKTNESKIQTKNKQLNPSQPKPKICHPLAAGSTVLLVLETVVVVTHAITPKSKAHWSMTGSSAFGWRLWGQQ